MNFAEFVLASFMSWWLLLSLSPVPWIPAIAIPAVAYGVSYIPDHRVILALAAGGVIILIGWVGAIFQLEPPSGWSVRSVAKMIPRPALPRRPGKATGRRYVPGESPGRRSKIPPL